jgi:hypothetical protein
LLVLQRLLEKQQQLRPPESASNPRPKAPRPATSVEPSGWIADMGRKMDSGGRALEWQTPPMPTGLLQLPNLRQRMVRAFDALRVRSGSGIPPLRQSARISDDV